MLSRVIKYIKRTKTFTDLKSLFNSCFFRPNKQDLSFGFRKYFSFILFPFRFVWFLARSLILIPSSTLKNNNIVEYAISKEYARYKFIMLILLITISLSFGFIKKTKDSDYIARITIDNVLTDDPNGYGGIKFYEKVIRQAIENEHIKAVIISISSGGGQVTAGEVLYKNLLKLSTTKPTFCDIGSIGASGAYMASLACKKIYAKETSQVGSIGVRISLYEMTDLAKKLGINFNIIASGDLKTVGDPWQKLSQKDINYLDSMVTKICNMFINLVAKERNLTVESVKQIADGSTMLGQGAKDAGLIDEIGDEDDIVAEMIKTYGFDKDIKVENLLMPKEDSESFSLRKLIKISTSVFFNTVKEEIALFNNGSAKSYTIR